MRDIYLWLNAIQIPGRVIEKLEDKLEDLEPLWTLTEKALRDLGLGDKLVDCILANRKKEKLLRYQERLLEQGAHYMTAVDENYPPLLLEIADYPRVLYYRGKPFFDLEPAVAVVGSRKCSDYGRWVTEEMVEKLASMGVVVVSGLALGIDRVAHDAALKASGKTVGVLGNGIDQIHPKSNRRTFEAMEEQGLILTEFPLGTPPLPHHFPMRNRIISGLSRALIVVEAQERSGTLITASLAAEQGREVFAVPGNINQPSSRGCNALIRDGATPLLEISDLLESLHLESPAEESLDLRTLEPHDLLLVEALIRGKKNADLLRRETGLSVAEVNTRLTMMELRGLVSEMEGDFVLTGEVRL